MLRRHPCLSTTLSHTYSFACKARNASTHALVAVPQPAPRPSKGARGVKARWTEADLEKLKFLGNIMIQTKKLPRTSDYMQAMATLPHRSYGAITTKFRQLYVEKHPVRKSHERPRWSAEEDDALMTGVVIYGASNWKHISSFVRTRTPALCYGRFQRMRDPIIGLSLPQNYWIRKHSAKIQQTGLEKISHDTPGAGSVYGEILRQQYKMMQSSKNDPDGDTDGTTVPMVTPVDDSLMRAPFTKAEDELILRLFRQYGSRWMLIANLVNAYNQCGSKDKLAPSQLRSQIRISQRFRAIAPATLNMLDTQTIRKKNKTRKRWTPEEDRKLHTAVKAALSDRAKNFSWAQVVRRMDSTRTVLQCRMRWVEFSGSHLEHRLFTEAEDKLMWPFAIAGSFNSLATDDNRTYTTEADFTLESGKKVKLNLALIVSTSLAHRSSVAVHYRIVRLQRGIKWLRDVARVERPQDHFQLVHRLASSPIMFRVGKPK
ncbi:hypothetical protein LPJ58_003139 [Coemansia sp. RSA 1591]|nr:hypothetical protein LPJ58_003139 [Coemansia sp. RSA 1591]